MVHYPLQGHYSCHLDSDEYAINQGDVRLLTVGIFLNDVPEGGELVFPAAGVPKEESERTNWRVEECPARCVRKDGISIKAKKGDAVFWYNVRPEKMDDIQAFMATNKMDFGEEAVLRQSVHCGAPVTSGEKLFANFWLTVPKGGFVDLFEIDEAPDEVGAPGALDDLRVEL
mmetsp:Transcript_33652/g.50891  ORF Transcript_33652/g.50891 Transcript_33652/m.50891 type:complete len:172 (+) Transcript_33652:2-517(+)